MSETNVADLLSRIGDVHLENCRAFYYDKAVLQAARYKKFIGPPRPSLWYDE